MNRFKLAWNVLSKLGPRVVWLRAQGSLKKALGWNRRQFKPRPWSEIDLKSICTHGTPVDDYANFKRSNPPQFLFPLGKPPAVPEELQTEFTRQPAFGERIKLLEANRCVNFFHSPSEANLDANTPDHLWGTSDKPWFEISDFLPQQGDLRTLWEPSRAAWAIDLARAHSRGVTVDAGTLYWRWVDSWMRCCPPWQGVQWKCGQESAVRLLALSIGFWSLADDPATTPERFVQFARLAWATGYRIDEHINYARSQKNNHALSEACGLMLIGHLFPEFDEAQRWFDRGRRVFCDELRRQVYSDGSYVQNSMNYHRVMLQTATIAALLARWHGSPFDSETIERIGKAEEFLLQMLDEKTGQPPLYGNNDGAWVLPLDECDFNDMRPAVQAAHYLVTGRRRFPAGPWDEDLLWLYGPQSLTAPQETTGSPESSAFTDGGYYTLRGPESWGMIRCHTHRDRSGQYDQLHFDLWWRGQNVLHDAGTYRYFPAEGRACEDYFQLSRSHNIVEIDGATPVERASRFLYFPWPKGRVRHFELGPAGSNYFEGEHSDYDRSPWGILVRRAIARLSDDVWLIVDDLLGEESHTALSRWHLPDVPVEVNVPQRVVSIKTSAGDCFITLPDHANSAGTRLAIVRGETGPQGFQGFAAPFYGERQPAPTLEIEASGQFPKRFISIFAGNYPAIWQPAGNRGQNQVFELRWNNLSWHIDLAPLKRSTDRIILGINPQASGTELPSSAMLEQRYH